MKALVFHLDIESDNQDLLREATHEVRRTYTETIRLAKAGVGWDTIPDRVADDVALVKNTLQRVVVKVLCTMESYYGYDDYRHVNIATRGIAQETEWTVPALNSLPQVRTVDGRHRGPWMARP